jgi:general secretion pathway protein F
MAAFEYVAIDGAGHHQKGVMQGDAPRQIRQKLRESGLIPIEVTEIVEKKTLISAFSFREKINYFLQRKLSSADLTLFTRQLATLVSAGMPIEEALRAVTEQTEKNHVKKILSAVHAKVLEGHSLAIALGSFPNVFSALYRASVAAGEQTGHLEEVLIRLADYTEKRQTIQQKVQQALIYPIIMLIVAFSIIAFLLTYVVPRIIGIFKDSGQELPAATQLLLSINHFISQYGWLLLLLIIIGIIAFQRALRYPKILFSWHKFILRLPVLGNMIKINNTAQFGRTLGTLSAAGVPVLDAMRIAADVVGNLPIRESVQVASERVKEGMAIYYALKQTTYFSPMSVHLVASGENSGQLEAMLERMADYQDQEITRAIEVGLSLFEPLLILTMGGIILFIVLAVLLPIFSLNQLVS